MQSNDSPEKIGVAFAQNGDKQTIPVASQIGIADGRASFNDGFPPITRIDILAGGVPPFGTDFNGILNAVTSSIRWENAGGKYPYDASFATIIGGYPKGALISNASQNGYWINLVDGNQNDPDAGGAGWLPLSGRGADYALDKGAANSYAADYSPKVVALADGMVLRFKAANSNTAASVFSPNGLPVKPIYNSQLTALSGGEIAAGSVIWLQYNSVLDCWVSVLSAAAYGSGGVALDGPVLVYDGSSNTYQITNYNAFASYSVSATGGTVSITGSQVSLTIPASSGLSGLSLTVTKTNPGGNPEKYVFFVAVGASSVNTPSVTFPGNGSTNVSLTPTLTGSAYATTPTGSGVHAYSKWQIATDSAFTNVVFDSGNDAVNLTSITVPSGNLSISSNYYVRVRYASSTIGLSAWSAVNGFATVTKYIQAPTVSVSDGPSNVTETPTITGSAFTVVGGTDAHASTDWRIIKVSDGSVVWQSIGNTTNKTSIVVPAGILLQSTSYKAQARYNSTSAGTSAWGEYSFTTRAQFFLFDASSAGKPYGGGYYAGANIVVGGTTYALVVAPAAQGGQSSGLIWKTSNTSSSGSTSVNDGLSNTNNMIAAGASAHPAANFCDGLSINGYNDWYLPARDELEICYRYLKPGTQTNNTSSQGVNNSSSPTGAAYTSGNPAQTIAAIFKTGNSEAFSESTYWSSSDSGPTTSWSQGFINGTQSNINTKSNSYNVRAVRRVAI